MADKGSLKVQCFNGDNYIPVDGSKVYIKQTQLTTTEIELTTNSIGLTEQIDLNAPPIEYSLDKNSNEIPYSLYDITVQREGFKTLIIRGCQIFPEEVAYQRCNLVEITSRNTRQEEIINILPNTLNGDFPPKIPEEVDKPLPPPSSGVVLSKPVIPEYIVVHQGSPNDPSAPNYKVPFKEYIKNVASCEIYSTWSSNAIRANIFCMLSFTLNRIYTEWYRGKGKNFDVSSSTAYDHAFNYGRNIYDSIGAIVDEIFSTYVRRIGKKQPLLTQYCDGKSVSCPEWLSQWGSQGLGSKGMQPFEILKYYYGNDIELVTAEKVEGSPKSYPDYDLTIGSVGEPVKTIQNQLNTISKNYPLIPKVPEDGVFGKNTAEAVKVFQGVFNLPKTGIVDYATWYKISDVYVGVTKIAELRESCSKEKIFIPPITTRLYDKNIPEFSYFEE
ncbi:peptidoglycan-binding domain-containing protein [Clostridium uliginosum]|uniref:Putative peptidoglycan binding domain-containing protein n=1 Tax=Clostridium uliginosum TaxID=119641 RepID=A0A1I1L6A8_9CLOT|nr:peptidoglycan-binding domain-containing protein [Clostridium uliginosum]SFC68597.1 Putative peptidoglycan binding domain-containing protein [Clostridium uliginosum]